MQAFIVERYGKKKALKQTDMPTPALIESGAIRPVVNKVFPFEATNDALAYVESGRAKGKVVIKVR